MQTSRKIHRQQQEPQLNQPPPPPQQLQQYMTQRSENGRLLPPPSSPRNMMKCSSSNMILLLMIIFFITAATILQLPTLNYLKYLTNGSENQSIIIKPIITSTTSTATSTPTSTPKLHIESSNTNNEETIDGSNDKVESDKRDGDTSSKNEDDDEGEEDDEEEGDGDEEEGDGGGDEDDEEEEEYEGDKDENEEDAVDEDEDDDGDEGKEEKNEITEEPDDGSNNNNNNDDDKKDDDQNDGSDVTTKASSGKSIVSKDDIISINDKDSDHDVDVNKNSDENDDVNEPHWEMDLSPKIVWLASYPNSGTSYTMTLVERASNLSTATNYGNEVTHPSYDSIPIYSHHEQGPFWEGTTQHAIELKRVIRNLPTEYILTKTHCGGRCIKCPASEYIVNTTRQFIYGCQKTSYRKNTKMITTEYGAPMSAIKKILHLIRNPYHNVVARFHLERKNMIAKDPSYKDTLTYDATGFHNYCHYLDTTYNYEDKTLLPSKLYKRYFRPKSDTFIPCAAEFYKWVQWHNYVVQSSVLLGLDSDRTELVEIEIEQQDGTITTKQRQQRHERSIPVHVIWYENYELDFNTTFISIMDFLQLPIATEQIREFRALPTYDDHFTKEQRANIQALIQYVAIPSTWKLIQHYFY